MKKIIILAFFLFCAVNAYSRTDTLSYWDRNGQLSGYQNIQWAFAAFYPEAPCYIKAFNVYVAGASGQITMVLLDHQGGSPVPNVFTDTGKELFLGAWTADVAPQQGYLQGVRVELPEPIWFPDNHFFIGVASNNPNLFLATDQSEHQPLCQSESGGSFLYQSIYSRTDEWGLGTAAFTIDVEVEYPSKSPANYLRDVTFSEGLPTDMPNASMAWADLDGDGWQDLLIRGRLFMNGQGVAFEEKTDEYGLEGSPRANAFLDMDNDGDLDLLFLNSNRNEYIKSVLYENQGGGAFVKHELSIPQLKGLQAFSIADVDDNGYPDLFLAQLWSEYPTAEPNYMFLNEGTGFDFLEMPGLCETSNARRSRGSQFVDFDDDGDLDLYVTNYYLEEDELWENVAPAIFQNIIDRKNIDVNASGHNHGTGVDWYDYDNDGDMDLLLPQFAHQRFLKQYDHRGTTIYNNSGAPDYTFTDTYDPETRSSGIGITYEETHAGAAWGDANNDGLADFVITTFYGCRYIDFYEQNTDHTFSNKTFDYGLEDIVTGTDACWVDFDNDGHLDLAMGIEGRFRLFRNYNEEAPSFIQIDLKRTKGYLVPDGARVKVFAGDNVYMQEAGSGRGQMMQEPQRLHYGLGQNQSVQKVMVRWPGETAWEEFTEIEINRIVTLTEGEGVMVSAEDESGYYFDFTGIKPNPAASDFHIDFTLPGPEYVTVEIFDLQGRKLSTAFEGIGRYGVNSIDFKASSFEPGAYYCTISAGNKRQTKLLTVIR